MPRNILRKNQRELADWEKPGYVPAGTYQVPELDHTWDGYDQPPPLPANTHSGVNYMMAASALCMPTVYLSSSSMYFTTFEPFAQQPASRTIFWRCPHCGTAQEEARLKCSNCGGSR